MTSTGLPPAELSLALRVLTPANRCDLAILLELTRLYVIAGETVPDPLRRYVAEPPALNRREQDALHHPSDWG